jgi:hypothetical protein
MEGTSVLAQRNQCSQPGRDLFPGDTLVMLVVVPLDQCAVYRLFAAARTGNILAEIRVRAAEIAKHRKHSF